MPDPARPASVLDLATSEYVLLTTYTRDGRPKPTPVWAAPDDDALVVITSADAWKVRRVRNRPDVTLAACDSRGNPRGDVVRGTAVVVDGVLAERVLQAVMRKYGWKMRLIAAAERLRGRRGAQGRAGVVVRDLP